MPVRDVLVDFVYQGVTQNKRPMLAGSNDNVDELITYISKSPDLMRYEAGRGRIDYLKRYKK